MKRSPDLSRCRLRPGTPNQRAWRAPLALDHSAMDRASIGKAFRASYFNAQFLQGLLLI